MRSAQLSELVRAAQLGISITEYRRRRLEATEKVVGPAMTAYREALASALSNKESKE